MELFRTVSVSQALERGRDMKFKFIILCVFSMAALLPLKNAHADRIKVPVAQIVVQNNEAGRRVSNNLLDIRGDSPAKKIKQYLEFVLMELMSHLI
mgnify:CR=1 FL=1